MGGFAPRPRTVSYRAAPLLSLDPRNRIRRAADLPAAPSTPNVDNFPIEINQHLARRFNLPPGGTAKAVLGYVTVRDNQAYFNGQPLNAKPLEGHTAWVQGLVFVAEGTRLASIGADRTVCLWSLR